MPFFAQNDRFCHPNPVFPCFFGQCPRWGDYTPLGGLIFITENSISGLLFSFFHFHHRGDSCSSCFYPPGRPEIDSERFYPFSGVLMPVFFFRLSVGVSWRRVLLLVISVAVLRSPPLFFVCFLQVGGRASARLSSCWMIFLRSGHPAGRHHRHASSVLCATPVGPRFGFRFHFRFQNQKRDGDSACGGRLSLVFVILFYPVKENPGSGVLSSPSPDIPGRWSVALYTQP